MQFGKLTCGFMEYLEDCCIIARHPRHYSDFIVGIYFTPKWHFFNTRRIYILVAFSFFSARGIHDEFEIENVVVVPNLQTDQTIDSSPLNANVLIVFFNCVLTSSSLYHAFYSGFDSNEPNLINWIKGWTMVSLKGPHRKYEFTSGKTSIFLLQWRKMTTSLYSTSFQ